MRSLADFGKYSSMLNPTVQQATMQFTPEMLGIAANPWNDNMGNLPTAYTMNLPNGQAMSGYASQGAFDPMRALQLANMYTNLQNTGFMGMQTPRGFNFPITPQAQAPQVAQPTLAPPPQGPTATSAIPLQAYSSMLNPSAGVPTAGLPPQMVNAIPSYLRR